MRWLASFPGINHQLIMVSAENKVKKGIVSEDLFGEYFRTFGIFSQTTERYRA